MLFGNWNLFQISEISIAVVTLAGNALAVITSYKEHLVNDLGIATTVTNLTFAILFLIGYGLELRKSKEFTDKNYIMEVQGK